MIKKKFIIFLSIFFMFKNLYAAEVDNIIQHFKEINNVSFFI